MYDETFPPSMIPIQCLEQFLFVGIIYSLQAMKHILNKLVEQEKRFQRTLKSRFILLYSCVYEKADKAFFVYYLDSIYLIDYGKFTNFHFTRN